MLSQLQATHGTDARISLGELTDALKARAYGVILLLMALPCCLPFVYILPQIMAFPMLFLTWQLASGRTTVWLPDRSAQASLRHRPPCQYGVESAGRG